MIDYLDRVKIERVVETLIADGRLTTEARIG